MHTRLIKTILVCLLFSITAFAQQNKIASFDEMVKSKHDVWGEAAMRQTNGASYEFFEKLLPPPRYVNADFRFYPIVLSAPKASVKARLISNGSGVNLDGGARSWLHNGTPMVFRVGPDEELFGNQLHRVTHPTLAEGYLPIAQIRYEHPSPVQSGGNIPLDQKRKDATPEIYQLEAFANVDPSLAENGVVFVKFSLMQGTNGFITVDVGSKSPIKFADGKAMDEKGNALAYFDKAWKWQRGAAHAKISTSKFAFVAIPTKPLSNTELGMRNMEWLDYDKQRERCVSAWKNILAEGMNVETPEPIVNNAWRNLLIQNFELMNGDRMHYSAGNQYNALYEAEGSDAALAMMIWGYENQMKRLMVPLFDFTRKGLEYHQAGFKLNDVCRYYWQTRDDSIIKEFRSWPKPKRYQTSDKEKISGWESEAKRLDEHRTGEHGLFPKERYCGDVSTPVQTLNANSKAWRALRDMATVLAEVGERAEAEHYEKVASDFRKTVLTAIEKSANHSTTPPFVPIALYTNEPPHSPICDTRIGSYWNIIIGYTIASGIFPVGSEQENWIPHYLEQHGGLAMGMLRAGGQKNTFWNSEYKINPLYGTRYALDVLRRDEPERALVSFYGMLAQGFTRNTFIGAEGCSLKPLDEGGRQFYCPPNSAANAHFLSMLRYALVQDSDLNDDGKPETLRLFFATSKRWLEDGKAIKVERAPTAFGPVSVTMKSKLKQGEVVADVQLPERNAIEKILLRARVPEGWKVISAKADGENLKADGNGTVDLTKFKGKVTVQFGVEKQ
jgi:hypothetical protein